MADVFNLPAVGDTMVEGEILEWFVSVGDVVDLDQPICSVETDKSVVEMTTPFRGTVLALGGAAGEVVEVGSALIIVGEPNESVPTSGAAAPDPAPAAQPAIEASGDTSLVTSPLVRKLAADLKVDLAAVLGTGPGGRVIRSDVENAAAAIATSPGPSGSLLAMPRVRREARERAIDLSTINGSGPGGSISFTDLPGVQAGGLVEGQSGGERRERLSAMRRSIAKHLTESVQTIPQFTSMVDVDATAVLATRGALRQRLDGPVPIDAVLMALMIPVLRDHPVINARLEGDDVVYFDRYDIGVAVDTPDGLILPVVTGADQRPIADLAAEIVRLASAARDRTIRPEELSGATCSINNVGALGVVAGTPILPLGTSSIVAFGVARPVVQLRNGNPVEVPTLTISATFDHRLIDGGDSGRFLAQLKQHLEVPALGLM